MPDTPDVLDLFDAIESGESAGDRTALLDALDARDAAVRTAAINEAAEALLKVDPVEWALAGQHAGNDAAKLILTLADSSTGCPRNPGGDHAFRPVALDPGRFCRYCGTPDPRNRLASAPAATAPTPQEAAEVLCRCGHTKDQHQDDSGLGGAQCRSCPGDTERSWRHPYTPETTAPGSAGSER